MTGSVEHKADSVSTTISRDDKDIDSLVTRERESFGVLPYQENDIGLPVDTIRAWVIGLSLSLLGAIINELFAERLPHIVISHFIAQLIAYPLGVTMARYLPSTTWSIRSFKVNLNPGPFNAKEHMLISILASVSYAHVGGSSLLIVQRLPLFYGLSWTASRVYQFLLLTSLSCMGYGLAGLSRSWLVYPRSAVWPHTLATLAMNDAFHNPSTTQVPGWRMSRLRFFGLVSVAAGIYAIIPGYVFTSLSLMNWPTWISPEDVVLAAIAGSHTGLGINVLPSLDLNIIFSMEPLIVPFSMTANVFLGTMFSGLICIPLLYFNNFFRSAFLPINANNLFDKFGHRYDVHRLLNKADALQAGPDEYSPVFLSAANAWKYGIAFAIYPATLVHTYLCHGTLIAKAFKKALSFSGPTNGSKEPNDSRSDLTSSFEEVPQWWYLVILASAFAMAAIMLSLYPTQLPVYTLLFSVILGAVFVIPFGIIASVSNVSINLGMLSEIVSGFALVGKPIAALLFNSFGAMITIRALGFSSDLKLGHYAKLPPKSVFRAQLVATLLTIMTSLIIVNWQIDNIEGFCQPDQPQKFSCPASNTMFSTSVIWGVLGPAKFFGPHSSYRYLLLGLPFGICLPLIPYLYVKSHPESCLRYCHSVLFLAGAMHWAPQNLSYVWLGFVMAYIFQVLIKDRYAKWHEKYIYLLAVGISVGTAVTAILLFSLMQSTGLRYPDWIGNNIDKIGCDARGCSLKIIPMGGIDIFHGSIG